MHQFYSSLKTYHKCFLGEIDDGRFCKLQQHSSFESSKFYLMRRNARKLNYSARRVCGQTTHIRYHHSRDHRSSYLSLQISEKSQCADSRRGECRHKKRVLRIYFFANKYRSSATRKDIDQGSFSKCSKAFSDPTHPYSELSQPKSCDFHSRAKSQAIQ